jgi:hypothetical protein
MMTEPGPTALIMENTAVAVWAALPIRKVVRDSRLVINGFPFAADLDLTFLNHPVFTFSALAFL